MTFYYTPMTEEEVMNAKLDLLPEGIYPFETQIGTDEISKRSRNPQIKLIHKIFYNGKEHTVWDYLLNTPNWMFKTKHYCDSVGLKQEYENQTFNGTKCAGKKGWCQVIIQKGEFKKDLQGNTTNERYDDKNVIKDYVMTALSVSRSIDEKSAAYKSVGHVEIPNFKPTPEDLAEYDDSIPF